MQIVAISSGIDGYIASCDINRATTNVTHGANIDLVSVYFLAMLIK
jgi:hypothetical protein